MTDLSFIIPSYNSEKTLARAVSSITQQGLASYEVLIIDDGSSDDTLKIAHKLAEDFNEVKVFTAGKGVSQARNVGLKNATGKWVTFLDADDFYLSDTLKTALKIADQNNAQLQLFSFEHGLDPVVLKTSSTEALSIQCEMLEQPTKFLTVWAKFFLREHLVSQNILFNEELTMSEDSEFVIRYAAACQSIAVSELILYHYSIDTPSATRSFDGEKLKNYLKSLEVVEKFIKTQPKALQDSFLKYVLIQVNLIAVRSIYAKNNPAPAPTKKAQLETVLDYPVVKDALDKLSLKDCLAPRFLPGAFLKLNLKPLAVTLFKLRTKQNQRKEKKA